MKIEAGKRYKTRGGEKVGPMERRCHGVYPWLEPEGRTYTDEGKYNRAGSTEIDLISEWPSEGPVRTVTRKEVVEGSYGIVQVYTHRDQVVISIDPSAGHNPTAAELRAAAAVMIELAEALEE